MDPFQIGTVWGIEQGWAVNPAQFGRTYRLPLGTYRLTESIHSGLQPGYSAYLRQDATATVVMKRGERKCLLCRRPVASATDRAR